MGEVNPERVGGFQVAWNRNCIVNSLSKVVHMAEFEIVIAAPRWTVVRQLGLSAKYEQLFVVYDAPDIPKQRNGGVVVPSNK